MAAETLTELSDALARAVARAAESTVCVAARRRHGASGIVWGPDTVVTAAHVIEHTDDVQVHLPNGGQLAGELAGIDAGTDVAVLRVDVGGAPPPDFLETPALGALALTVGRASADDLGASLGIISGVGGRWRTRTGAAVGAYLRTDARMLPGFSGGPLVGASGGAFGMNTSLLARDGGFTIPADALAPIVDSLLEHGRMRRAFLGVATQPIRLEQAGAPSDVTQRHGLLVTGVDSDGAAAQGGVLLGDVILALDADSVEETSDLLNALGPDRIGAAVPLRVLRARAVHELDVTPGERD